VDVPVIAPDQRKLHDHFWRAVHLPRYGWAVLRQDEAGAVLRDRGRGTQGRLQTVTAIRQRRFRDVVGVIKLVVRAAVVLMGAIVLALSTGMAQEIDETKLKTYAAVTWFDVAAPFGNFILIRKGASLCALRFTEYHRGNDAKPPTVWSSNEESLDAKYECFCQSEKSVGFGRATLGQVNQRALWGIGRLAFGGGEQHVRCGSFKLAWMYPIRVSFHPKGTRLGDHGIELAPTRWSAIHEVNVSDSRLRWFRLAERRKETYIPIEDL
jgi:hypothetical protein